MNEAKKSEHLRSGSETQNDPKGGKPQFAKRSFIPYIIIALLLLFLTATSFYLRRESADLSSHTSTISKPLLSVNHFKSFIG